MKYRGRVIAVGLLTVLLAAIVGLVLTGDSEQSTLTAPGKGGRLSRFLVDERPVLTARALAQFATTGEERIYAEEALASADDEVEIAFSDALRNIKEDPVALQPESRELYDRASHASAVVTADQERADLLSKQLAQAKGSQQNAIRPQLELVRAQLSLDQDELQDAKQDLVRVVGDVTAIGHRIQRQFDRHKLFERHGLETPSTESATHSSDAGYDAGNLVAQVAAWYTLSAKTMLLRRATAEAQRAARVLSQTHAALAGQTREVVNRGRAAQTGSSAAASAYRLDVDPEALAHLSKRATDEDDLGTTYGDWFNFAASRQRVALHGLTRSLLWIMLIIPSVFFVGRAVDHFLTKLGRTHAHLANLNAVFRFAVQAAGVLLILIVVFGVPQQVPEAIFGIVGAGVTVALKNFSGAFIDSRIRGLLGASANQVQSAGE